MRVMTTADARKRMCPMKMVGLASSSADRCRADECMAWRWYLLKVHEHVTGPIERTLRMPGAKIAHQGATEIVWAYKTEARPDVGYCGMAITPTPGEAGVLHRQATEDEFWPLTDPGGDPQPVPSLPHQQPPTATEE